MSFKLTSKIAALTAGFALVSSLSACSTGSGNEAEATSSSEAGGLTEIVVGASPSPHAKILEFLNESGEAEKAGLKITIKEFTDYIQPNKALESKELDANYFQTVPYLEDQTAEYGYDFVPGKGVHLEPLAIYSDKLKSIEEVKDGATVGIINDPTNQGRAIRLLTDQGLLNASEDQKSVLQIADDATANPHKLQFKEVEGAALTSALPDVDIAVINGNFALEGGLSPKDALAIESTENNPAANLLVWRNGDDNPAIAKLEELLHTDAVRQYIEETWTDKSVIPVF